MKSSFFALLPALIAQQAAAHATFQQLWVDGQDQGTTCARLPLTNSPITSVTGNDIRCNAGVKPVASKCSVAAGLNVTVEMHQQPNDRNCKNEAIGGAHWGPVIVYMSKVSDSATADGSSGWFKIYEDGWKKNPSGTQGDEDFWGTKTMNTNCGKVDVVIPADIASGDYLLRAEAIALHASGSEGGAQPYVTCYQLSVTGGGSAEPETVLFPGAYTPTDPGILVNIHQPMTGYTIPGPAVYGGGASSGGGSGGNAPAVSEKPPAATTAPAAATSAPAAAPTGGSGSGSGSGGDAATSAVAAVPTTFATVKAPATTAPAAAPSAGTGEEDDSCDAETEEPVAAPTAAPSAGAGDEDDACDAETEAPVAAPTAAPSSGAAAEDDSCDADTEEPVAAPTAAPTAGAGAEDDACDAETEEPVAAPTTAPTTGDDECEA